MSLIVTPGVNGSLNTMYVPDNSPPSSYTYWYKTADGVDIEVTAHTSNSGRAETVRTDIARLTGWTEQEEPNDASGCSLLMAGLLTLIVCFALFMLYIGCSIAFGLGNGPDDDRAALMWLFRIGGCVFVLSWIGLAISNWVERRKAKRLKNPRR